MIERLDAWFVDCWRNAWRWWSVRTHALSTLIIGLLTLVPAMPQELQDLMPGKVRAVLVAAWFGLGLWLRLKKQGSANGE